MADEARSASGILALVPALADIPAAARPYTPEEQAADEARYRREVWLLQQRGETRAERLMRQGVPEDMANIIAAREVRETKAVQFVRRWLAQDKRRLLILAGRKDASKTAASSVAVDEALTKHLAVGGSLATGPRLIPVEKLADAWRYYDRTKKGAEPFDPATGTNKAQMLACPLLALDDVGQEEGRYAEAVGEVIEIVSYRNPERGLWVLLTTNYEQMGKADEKGRYLDEKTFLGRYPMRAQRLERTIRQFGIWATCPFEGLRPKEHTRWTT